MRVSLLLVAVLVVVVGCASYQTTNDHAQFLVGRSVDDAVLFYGPPSEVLGQRIGAPRQLYKWADAGQFQKRGCEVVAVVGRDSGKVESVQARDHRAEPC